MSQMRDLHVRLVVVEIPRLSLRRYLENATLLASNLVEYLVRGDLDE